MSDLNIEDATRDESVTGSELIPVSDAGEPKSVSTGQIKDFVVSAISSAAVVQPTSETEIVSKDGSTLKSINVSSLADRVTAIMMAKAGVVNPNGNEKIVIDDNGVRKTVTASSLKTFIQAGFDISTGAESVSSVLDTDVFAFIRGDAKVKAVFTAIRSAVLSGFGTWASGITSATGVSPSSTVVIWDGVTSKKATLSQIVQAAGGGDTLSPSSTTPGKIPAWSNTSKKLDDGYSVAQSISSSPSSSKIPTEAAVAQAIENAVQMDEDVVTTDGLTDGVIPVADGTKGVRDGFSATTTVSDVSSASDAKIPTEKAVRSAIDAGSVKAPASHAENYIPLWDAGNALKSGVVLTQAVNDAGTAGENEVPSAAAVRAAIPGLASQSADGIMSALDKKKLDGIVDTSAVDEIGKDLDDSDTFVVRDNDVTNRKSLMSRVWSYILKKLPSVRIDQFASPADNTNGNATTTAHGLLQKLPGGTTTFLRGDGQFATPAGTTDFTGDTGTGGEHGLVPAPTAGDGAANKFLCANGQWAVTPAAAGVDIPGSPDIVQLSAGDAVYVYKASTGTYARASADKIASFVNGTLKYDTMFVPAGAFAPSTVDGCAMSAMRFTENTHDVATFLGDSDTSAEFNVVLPDDWNGGEIKVKIIWTCGSASAEAGQTAAFTVAAIAIGDGDAASNPPTGGVIVTDALLAVNEVHVSPASTGISVGDSPSAGSVIHFRISRAVSNGSISEALNVFGVNIQFARSATTEAW